MQILSITNSPQQFPELSTSKLVIEDYEPLTILTGHRLNTTEMQFHFHAKHDLKQNEKALHALVLSSSFFNNLIQEEKGSPTT